MEDLNSLSVSALKAKAFCLALDTSDCLEKNDLVTKIAKGNVYYTMSAWCLC